MTSTAMASMQLGGGRPAWSIGLQAIAAAVAGNLILRGVARGVFDIPSQFAPLATPGPTIFLTVVGVGAALVVAVIVGRVSGQPVRRFRHIAIVALLLSLVPDGWLLTESASESFPGATLAAVLTLMAQHLLAAGVVVWMLTGRPSLEATSSPG